MIIVIAILAVIAGLAVPMMIQNVRQSRIQRDIANAEVVAREATAVLATQYYEVAAGVYNIGSPSNQFETDVNDGLHHEVPEIVSYNAGEFYVVITSTKMVEVWDGVPGDDNGTSSDTSDDPVQVYPVPDPSRYK